MDAEEFEAGGDGPVEERGLFEVADAVGVEGDPVVAEEHLAGDLGVDGVGVVEEGRSEEGEAGIEEEPEGEEDEAISLDLGLGGGDVHAVRSGVTERFPRRVMPHFDKRIYGAAKVALLQIQRMVEGKPSYQQSLRERAGAINDAWVERVRGYDGRARCCRLEAREFA